MGIVLVGGVIVWVFDRRDFPDLGGALWYTLQTVTTVGYGDKVPTEGIGRLVEEAVMVVAVALIAILTASVTSTSSKLRSAGIAPASKPRSATGRRRCAGSSTKSSPGS